MKTNEPANPKWRKLPLRRFSLRALLLVVTALCIWFAVVGNRARRQWLAAQAVRDSGGLVAYDFHRDQNVKSLEEGEPPGPAWLREFVGIDFLSDVVLVQLTNPKAEVIDKLPDFPALEQLGLFDAELNDAKIEVLCNLKRLQKLLILTKRGSLPAAHVDALKRALPHTEIVGDL
jgi:hypothetical protein